MVQSFDTRADEKVRKVAGLNAIEMNQVGGTPLYNGIRSILDGR
jgi:hypothetical protein